MMGGISSLSSPLALVPCCHTVSPEKGYIPHRLSGMIDADGPASMAAKRAGGTMSKSRAVGDVVDEMRVRALRGGRSRRRDRISPRTIYR